jgi:hypothetical protein
VVLRGKALQSPESSCEASVLSLSRFGSADDSDRRQTLWCERPPWGGVPTGERAGPMQRRGPADHGQLCVPRRVDHQVRDRHSLFLLSSFFSEPVFSRLLLGRVNSRYVRPSIRRRQKNVLMRTACVFSWRHAECELCASDAVRRCRSQASKLCAAGCVLLLPAYELSHLNVF